MQHVPLYLVYVTNINYDYIQKRLEYICREESHFLVLAPDAKSTLNMYDERRSDQRKTDEMRVKDKESPSAKK
jgi:hypothetical protein